MWRKAFIGTAGLIVLAAVVSAADTEISGKLVKIETTKRIIVVKTAKTVQDVPYGVDFKVFDGDGKVVKEGLKDKRLVTGAAVELVIPDKGRVAHELHIVPVEPVKEVKPAPKTKEKPAPVEPKTTPEAKTKTKEKPAPVEPKTAPSDEKTTTTRTTKHEIKNGLHAKVVSVDTETKQAVVTTEDGKKLTLAITDETKFIGPRGGHSSDGIEDDRFVAGAEIIYVLAPGGKSVSEVHLPYRKHVPAKDK